MAGDDPALEPVKKVRCFSKTFWIGASVTLICAGLVLSGYAMLTGGCSCSGQCIFEIEGTCHGGGCESGDYSARGCTSTVEKALLQVRVFDCTSFETESDCNDIGSCIYDSGVCKDKSNFQKMQCKMALTASQCTAVTDAQCEWRQNTCNLVSSGATSVNKCSFKECIYGGYSMEGYLSMQIMGWLFVVLGGVSCCGTCPILCFVEPPNPVKYGPDGVTQVAPPYKGIVGDDTYINDYGIALTKEGYPRRLRAQLGGYTNHDTPRGHREEQV